MSIALAETLKRDLTDKYVVVKQGVAELRRFDGLTGQVKTVNMNGQVLVQFDGPVDISWYDIHPNYLIVVDAPQPKAKGHAGKDKEATEKPAAKAKAPAAAGEKKLSPLEQARAQGAGGAAKPAAPAGEKKLSPLEMARAQGAGGAAKLAPAAEKKASPLDQARQQGAAKAEAPAAEAAAPPAKSAGGGNAKLATPGSTAEIIALARQQGAVKG